MDGRLSRVGFRSVEVEQVFQKAALLLLAVVLGGTVVVAVAVSILPISLVSIPILVSTPILVAIAVALTGPLVT